MGAGTDKLGKMETLTEGDEETILQNFLREFTFTLYS
jgi:hypothetical protein